MSQAEQSRPFIKGLSTDLWHKIFTRLSIKEPDHDPNGFWPLEDVRKSGEYRLNGMNPPVLLMGMGISSNPSFSSGLTVGSKYDDHYCLVRSVGFHDQTDLVIITETSKYNTSDV